MTHDAAWYAEAMLEEGSPALLPLEDSPWLLLYTEVAKMIDAHEPVVDLGCGTGRFVKLLLDRGHYADIEGVDWAQELLDEAEGYTDHRQTARWTLCDLAQWQPDPERAGGTVYVSLETLEHLDDDLELVRRIPPGHRFLFSVPNYWSASHVRYFPNVSGVWAQYSQLLDMRRWIHVPIDHPTKMIHLVEGRRRSDSWE